MVVVSGCAVDVVATAVVVFCVCWSYCCCCGCSVVVVVVVVVVAVVSVVVILVVGGGSSACNVRCPLFVVCWLLSLVRCPVFPVRCLLAVYRNLLCAVCGFLYRYVRLRPRPGAVAIGVVCILRIMFAPYSLFTPLAMCVVVVVVVVVGFWEWLVLLLFVYVSVLLALLRRCGWWWC